MIPVAQTIGWRVFSNCVLADFSQHLYSNLYHTWSGPSVNNNQNPTPIPTWEYLALLRLRNKDKAVPQALTGENLTALSKSMIKKNTDAKPRWGQIMSLLKRHRDNSLFRTPKVHCWDNFAQQHRFSTLCLYFPNSVLRPFDRSPAVACKTAPFCHLWLVKFKKKSSWRLLRLFMGVLRLGGL